VSFINLESKTQNENDILRRDLNKIEQAINIQQQIIDLASRTSDPSPGDTSGKIQIWYRRDLQQIRFNDNGTTYKLQASLA
jgi:hypothetical protein